MSATELYATTAGVDISVLDQLSDSTISGDSRDVSVNASTSAARYSILTDSATQGSLDTDSLDEVVQFIKENPSVFWMDCQEPTIDDIADICKVVFGGLHPLTIEIIAGTQHRDTFQELKSYLFSTFGPLNTIIMSEKGIVSITRGPSPFRGSVQQRLHKSLPFRTDWICYALVDKMTRQMLPVIRSMDEESKWVNDHVYVDFDDVDGKAVLDRLAETRRNVMIFLGQIRGKLEVVQSLGRRWAENEVGHYFLDVEDNLTTMKTRLEAHETLLGNSHRNWMAVTQMNLEKTKSKVLVVVGMFLSLATVFVPMITVYTSGHMNLEGPGMNKDDTHSLAWWGAINGVVVGLAAFVVFSSYRFFRYVMHRPPPSLTGEYK